MSTTTAAPSQRVDEPAPRGRAARRRAASAKNRGNAKPARPSAASVNLLSPWVFEELRVHQLRRRFLLGGVVLLVVVALVWSGLRFNLHRANTELRGEEAVGAGLSDQLSDLAPVRTYVDGVERRVVTVTGATYDDVAFSRVLAALALATPAAASLDAVSVELAAAEPTKPSTGSSSGTGSADAAPSGSKKKAVDPARGLVGDTCPGPDPFGTKVVIGCLTLSGTAASRDVVSSLVMALGADKIFVEPFIDTTTTGDEGAAVSFSGSVGLSPAAFSGRYDSLGEELTKGAAK